MDNGAAIREVQVQAEEALLGCLIILGTDSSNTTEIEDIERQMQPCDFIHPYHPDIYKAINACKHPNQIVVAEELARSGKLKEVTCAYLSHLVSICPCVWDYQDFIDTLKRCSGKQGVRPKFTDGLR